MRITSFSSIAHRVCERLLSRERNGLWMNAACWPRKRCERHMQSSRCKSIQAQQTFVDTVEMVQMTVASRDHLVPEILLRLITPSCPLWSKEAQHSHFRDPFWAFFWPGGQGLARYILDHPSIVKGKTVLDVGSGSGACAIAAAKAGAGRIVANDIDPVAMAAIRLNAELNAVQVETSQENFIGRDIGEFDLVVFGDMLYDVDFTSDIVGWIKQLKERRKEVQVLVGDPGRWSFTQPHAQDIFTCVAKYELSEASQKENNGFSHVCIWKAK